MDILTLGHGHRKGVVFESGMTKADRKYIDFIVSRQSLGQLVGIPGFDLVGTFGWTEEKECEDKLIDEFLGIQKAELETGRTCFYVCPECGDIGCGAITAKIEVGDLEVVWKDFGYENDYSEPDLSDYKHIGPFIFDKKQYFQTLQELKTRTQK